MCTQEKVSNRDKVGCYRIKIIEYFCVCQRSITRWICVHEGGRVWEIDTRCKCGCYHKREIDLQRGTKNYCICCRSERPRAVASTIERICELYRLKSS